MNNERRFVRILVLAVGLILFAGWFVVDWVGLKEKSVQRSKILSLSQHTVAT
ncbi:MAG: hypothetical protein HQL25_09095, partial [Candidatus Omnitrophica bacterium]|nr:hypothetical protein [Candidatus Omnitrophota bacterium]